MAQWRLDYRRRPLGVQFKYVTDGRKVLALWFQPLTYMFWKPELPHLHCLLHKLSGRS